MLEQKLFAKKHQLILMNTIVEENRRRLCKFMNKSNYSNKRWHNLLEQTLFYVKHFQVMRQVGRRRFERKLVNSVAC